MAKFYFIDGSLRSAVGHHDTFARLVLSAVERFGFVPVVAAHRDLDRTASVGQRWQVERVFSHSIYDDPVLMPAAVRRFDWRERWVRLSKHKRRAVQVRSHARDFAALMTRVRPRSGDQFFVATAAELVARGLSTYLRTANLPDVDWHLLFHFDALVGQAAPSQRCRLNAFHRALTELREVIPAGRLHLYATTERLAKQYRAAASPAPVEVIDYPIETTATVAKPHAGGPLRVVYAGEARIEKGFAHLPNVVRMFWERIERGEVEFLIQANFGFKAPCRRRNRPLVHARDELERMATDPAAGGRIQLIKKPPSAAEYAQLLSCADIGLLPYDGEHYYARCSGVLLELLSRGVPVVVPAECALADQIRAGKRDAAGRTFTRPKEIASAVAEIVDHYDRYAAAAQQLGLQIARAHDARRLVAKLLGHQTAWPARAPRRVA
jgi:glycosyltransferase involved in cell wall biosynthesis